MKTKTLKKVTVMAMATALLALNSCQKEKPSLQNPTPGTEVDLGTAALDASHIALNSLANSGNSFKLNTLNCAVITDDSISKPHVYTVDYGNGCVGSDGILRSGKVIVKYDSKNYRLVNNTLVTTYQNYVQAGDQIAGSTTLKNAGYNSNGNLHFTEVQSVQDTHLGQTSQITANYDYEWTAGESTMTESDDVFTLRGSASGRMTGSNYTNTFTSPLVESASCGYEFVQGVATLVQTGQPTKTSNYGNGTCSGVVTVTQNGVTTINKQTGNPPLF